MKERCIKLTLDKAKEWYNSGSEELKEVALQAFSEKELKTASFENITSFYDVLNALDLDITSVHYQINNLEGISEGAMASAKLSLIRKALNLGHKMDLTNGTIYYPDVRFITEKSTYYDDEIKSGTFHRIAKFKVDNTKYWLVGGYAVYGCYAGLGAFNSYSGVGNANANVGFLGCATREIAEHMSKYFAKEIFEAMYSDFVNIEWL